MVVPLFVSISSLNQEYAVSRWRQTQTVPETSPAIANSHEVTLKKKSVSARGQLYNLKLSKFVFSENRVSAEG